MGEENGGALDFFSEVLGLFNSDIVFPNVKDTVKAFLAKHYAGFEIIPDYGIQVSENDFTDLVKGYASEEKISEKEENGLKFYEKEYKFYAGCENISGAACDYIIKKLHIKYYVKREDKERVYTITYIAGFTVIESPEIYVVKGPKC